MAYYNKIGLFVLNDDGTKFLACEKSPKNITSDYILPGGRIEAGEEDVTCLKREIREELDCDVDLASLEYLGEYVDVAAGRPDKDVSIKLYKGKVLGTPKPSSEIRFLHWIGAVDAENPRLSPILRRKIIPDLVKRGILKTD